MTLAWETGLRQLADNWPADTGAWVLASIALYVGGSWGWVLLRRMPLGEEIQWSAWGYAARWLARLGFLAGIPYLALLLGVASPRLMGLTEVDWLASLAAGAGVALAGLALWVFALWAYRRWAPRRADAESPLWVLAVLEAVALQLHWAFYRSVTLLVVADAWWGVWVGALLVGLEAVLGPSLWQRGWTPARWERLAAHATLLLVTTALFFATRNLWLGVLFHTVAAFLLAYGVAGFGTAGQRRSLDT